MRLFQVCFGRTQLESNLGDDSRSLNKLKEHQTVVKSNFTIEEKKLRDSSAKQPTMIAGYSERIIGRYLAGSLQGSLI